MRTVYLNGHFVPESEAKLSIYDLSVMQAAAAFEMTRSFNGRHFKLREHLERLERSCALLSIPVEVPDVPAMTHGSARAIWSFMEVVESLCHEVSRLNDHGPGEEHRLLIVVSPGCAPMYKDLEGVIPHPFVYIADFPLRYTVAGFGKYFTEGVHCVTSDIQQVPDACVPSAAKHRSRLHFHLAQQQAPPGTWPIIKSQWGYLTEAPGANLVMVRKGKVWVQRFNALQGISLQAVQELTLTENTFSWNCDQMPDELWLTGTPFCMLPVASLDGKPIGDGTPGPVYRETLAKWSELVGLDIQQQICDWDSPSRLWTPDAQRLSTAQH